MAKQMNFIKSALAATAVTFCLSSPVLAYSDEVVLAAIDERVQSLQSELDALRIAYQSATSNRMRRQLKRQFSIVYSRQCQLHTAAHWVKKLDERKNKKIIAYFHLNVASPSA